MKTQIVVASLFGAITLVSGATSAKDTNAGRGDPYPYIIREVEGATLDKLKIEKPKHYIAIEAVSWFVNSESTWLKSRMASGKVDLNVEGTQLSFPLGTFVLSKGAKTAPVFSLPLLPTTPYGGGNIQITVVLTGLDGPTVLGQLLQDVAGSLVSLGSTAFKTYASSQPLLELSGAADSATKTANSLVQNLGKSQVPIFDLSGSGITLFPQDLFGEETYVLIHRGTPLTGRLSISSDRLQVLESGKPIKDGAWILLRVRREPLFTGKRPWTAAYDQAVIDLKILMTQMKQNAITPEEATKRLGRSDQGSSGDLFGDRFAFILSSINADRAALTGDQQLSEEANASEYISSAIEAAKKKDAQQFFTHCALLEGKTNALSLDLKAVVASLSSSIERLQASTPYAHTTPTPTLELATKTLELTVGKADASQRIQSQFVKFRDDQITIQRAMKAFKW